MNWIYPTLDKTTWKFYVVKWLMVLLILYIAWTGAMYALQEKFIFQPRRDMITHPIARTLKWDEVSLKTKDGETLSAWWMDNGAERTVLYFQGNGANISYHTGQLFIFQKLGLNALMFDYRGYGESTGNMKHEADFYEDAATALRFLTEEKNIPTEKILLWGRSIGTAGTVELASEGNFAGVILESGFPSLGEVAQYQYPMLPARWLVRYKFLNEEKMKRVHSPVLIFHSKEDEVIPFAQGEKLFAAAREPKKFVELKGTHDRMISDSTEEYWKALREFLEES